MSPAAATLILFIILIASASCTHLFQTLVATRKSPSPVKAR